MRDLQRHIGSVHEKSKLYKCELCKSDFKLKHHLVSHEMQCRSFQCYTCFQKFPSKRQLNNHVRSVHDKKKLFTCSICHKSFTRNINAQAHIKKLHQNNLNAEIIQVKNEKIAKYKLNSLIIVHK